LEDKGFSPAMRFVDSSAVQASLVSLLRLCLRFDCVC